MQAEVKRHIAIHAADAFRSGEPFDIVVLAHLPTELEEGWDEIEIEISAFCPFLHFDEPRVPLRLRANESSEPAMLTCRLTGAPATLKKCEIVFTFAHRGRYCGSQRKEIRII